MAKPEGSFITGVHRYVQSYCMKNHNEYVGGVADCWYSGKKRDLWAEYKFIVVPKRDSTMIVPELSPLQLQWLTNRQEEGRHIKVIIGCKDGGVVLDHPMEWATGLTAKVFRERILTRPQLAAHIDDAVNK